MTTKRSLRIKIKIRILSASNLFLAVLTVLIAFAAPAQQTDTGQPSARSSAAPVAQQASVPTLPGAANTMRTSLGRRPKNKFGDTSMSPGTPLFLPAVTYGSGGGGAESVAVADVNGDGKPDLLVANICTNTNCDGSVGVLLGNGDGTFQTAITYSSGGGFSDSVAVADVNGDGKLDLIVANLCDNNNNHCSGSGESGVGVLLGNGDGTFQAALTFPSGGTYIQQVVVVDMNRDGIPDLVVVNSCAFVIAAKCPLTQRNGTVGVLLGNGDGTFRSVVTHDTGGLEPTSIAVADLNGDGNPDVVAANPFSNTVGVLIGRGDGTFKNAVTYYSAYFPYSVAIADLNGDGKLDVAVANASISGAGTAGVLLGNGNGTFQPIVDYDSGGLQTTSIAVADVNGDGKPDLLVANSFSSTVGALLGNGDGTFQAALTYSGGGGPYSYSVAVADVNGDGRKDVMLANANDSTVGVLLNDTGSTQAQPLAYVTNSRSSSVSVIDTATNAVTATIGVGTRPMGVAFTPDGSRVYVANPASNSVSVIDTATSTVIATIGDESYPQGLAVTPDGSRVYTANASSNNIGVIDTASNTVIAHIGVGSGAAGVAFTPDGSRAYVTNKGPSSVSVIDTVTK